MAKTLHKEDFIQRIAKGNVKGGTCGTRVRTVTACQGSEICPSGCVGTIGIVDADEVDLSNLQRWICGKRDAAGETEKQTGRITEMLRFYRWFRLWKNLQECCGELMRNT